MLILVTLSAVPSLSMPAVTLTPRDALASVVIFATGDILSQHLEQRPSLPRRLKPTEPVAGAAALGRRSSLKPTIRPQRVLSAAGLGLVYGGALLPSVYQLAEGLFPGVSLRTVMAKTLLACSLLSTFGNWFSLMWRRCAQPSPAPPGVESFAQRLSRVSSSVAEDMPSVFKADMRVWPAYDTLSFSVIPPLVRPLTTVIVSTMWHTFIAYRAAVPRATAEKRSVS